MEYTKHPIPGLGLANQWKFVLAGNQVSVEFASKSILLVVDAAVASLIQPAVETYKDDLAGDGYKVQQITAPRIDVPRTPPPDINNPASIAAHFSSWKTEVANLKKQIRTVWNATPDLTDVVLVGHVAVPYSGDVNPEVHADHRGAWPADVFYCTLSVPDSPLG